MKRYHLSFLSTVLLCAVVGSNTVFAFHVRPAAPQGIKTAAMDQTAQGITLYQQGKNEEAIKILKDAAKRYNNLHAWHYLGLALEKSGKTKDARKAHEKAAKLGSKLIDAQLNSVWSFQDTAKAFAVIRTELAEASLSAQKYIDFNPKLSPSKREDWSRRADELQGFAEWGGMDSSILRVFKPSEVDTKARVISKPDPSYTEEARSREISGVVILKALFLSSGRVIAYPVKTLPAGLTEQALRAARQIKFIPAVKDGKPVTMAAQLEYTFTIY